MVVGKESPGVGASGGGFDRTECLRGLDSEAQLRAHLREYLSDYKQPKSILYVKQLPLLENAEG